MGRKHLFKITAAFTLVIILMLACGTNTGSKVGENTVKTESTPVPAQTYKVGDIVQVKDHTITLNSASIQNGILNTNFTVENKGKSDLTVSSMLNFSAKDNEGTKLESAMFDCGSSQLDGKVLPGDKLKGDLCWKATTSLPVKIYYEAELFGSGAVVWVVEQ